MRVKSNEKWLSSKRRLIIGSLMAIPILSMCSYLSYVYLNNGKQLEGYLAIAMIVLTLLILSRSIFVFFKTRR